MRVALLSTGHPVYDRFPSGGGIQQQIYHTAKELHRKGHEPTVLTRQAEEVYEDGVRFEQINVLLEDDVLSRILFGRRATHIITEIDPDVILTYERFSALFPSRLRYPSLFFTENYDAMNFYRPFATDRNRLNHLFFPLKRRVEEHVMRNSSRVVALHSEIQDYLDGCGITHTVEIPNGVDHTAYQSKREEGFVLFAARLNEVKGCSILLDAFAEVAPDFPDIELVIAGDGEQRRMLEREVSTKGISQRVQFTGWLDNEELNEYYCRCNAYVLPSYFEVLPVALLEAMAAEKAVIASDVMGPRNVVDHGENGLLFEAGNEDLLEVQMREALSDGAYRSTLGSNARRTIEEQYSFRVTVRQIIEVSNQIRLN